MATLKVQQESSSPTSSVFDLPIQPSASQPTLLKPNIRVLSPSNEPKNDIQPPAKDTNSFVVISGGTGGNAICTAFGSANAYFVLPVSDDGGSSSEIIRVLGGPSIGHLQLAGDIRSRLVRLIPPAPSSSPLDAIRTLLAYRLPTTYSERQAREEWRDIVEGKSHLWHGIPTDRKETIRGFLVYFESEILKRAHKNFNFLNGSIGNYFLAAAQGFFRSLPSAIFLFSSITNSGANILPVIVTNHTVTIAAELENGERLVGQCEISHPVHRQSTAALTPPITSSSAPTYEEWSPIDGLVQRQSNVMFEHNSKDIDSADKDSYEPLHSRISRLLYINAYGMEIHPSANPEYISTLGTTDALVYSCGSLWTSIIPCLALRGVGSAIARSRSLKAKVLLLNTENDRETEGYTAVDYVQAITRTLNETYEPQLYGIGNARTQYPVSAFITDLVYLKQTKVEVDVRKLTALGVRCTEAEGEGMKFDVTSVRTAIDDILKRTVVAKFPAYSLSTSRAARLRVFSLQLPLEPPSPKRHFHRFFTISVLNSVAMTITVVRRKTYANSKPLLKPILNQQASATSTELHRCSHCGSLIGAERVFFIPSNILLSSCATNDAPSEFNLRTLQKQYKMIPRAKVALNTLIGRLEAVLMVLKGRGRDLDRLLPAYKRALNPLRLLPHEILVQIFGFCVDEDVDIGDRMRNTHRGKDCPSTLDTRKCPWVLAQVCRRWRDLVISLAVLWTCIDVNWKENLSGGVLDSCMERRLSLALQRSRDRPLSVSWSQNSCQDKVLSIMCSRSYQWKKATIRAGIKGFKLLAPHCGLFPSLSTLYLHFDEDDWGQPMQGSKDDTFSVFWDVPALSKLTLSGRLGSVVPRLLAHVPWKQIASFEMSGMEGFDLADIRPIVPLLTSASYCIIEEFKFIGGPIRPPSTLRHLHTLILGRCSSADALFDSVTLPALQSLQIFECFPPVLTFTRFLRRSSCQIEELVLMCVLQQELIEVLQAPAVQSVKALVIGETLYSGRPHLFAVGDEILHALRLKPTVNGSGSDNVLPKLTRLDLWGTKQWSDTCLVEMLASRVNLHHTLFPSASRMQIISFQKFGLAGREDGLVEDEAASVQMKGLVEGGLVALMNGKPVVF
ncbi:hypothetical protein V5O48_010973 [Marasmius crinis-equi]|uniref:F-box domain-containing protein n=1 Tax=Marasmius crinis-equi TaxID=585013 RepID=A0ABR3F784_9AGAR